MRHSLRKKLKQLRIYWTGWFLLRYLDRFLYNYTGQREHVFLCPYADEWADTFLKRLWWKRFEKVLIEVHHDEAFQEALGLLKPGTYYNRGFLYLLYPQTEDRNEQKDQRLRLLIHLRNLIKFESSWLYLTGGHKKQILKQLSIWSKTNDESGLCHSCSRAECYELQRVIVPYWHLYWKTLGLADPKQFQNPPEEIQLPPNFGYMAPIGEAKPRIHFLHYLLGSGPAILT